MIYSMTGYANTSRDVNGNAVNVDIRAVNHRYLDTQFRMPDELRAIEPQLREMIAAKLTRGKVEVRVSIHAQAKSVSAFKLNGTLLQQIMALADEVERISPSAGKLKVADLLRWPGVLEGNDTAAEVLQATTIELLRQALNDFTASRQREGEKMGEAILARVDKMEQWVEQVEPMMPSFIATYREKIGTRLKEAMINLEDDRIRQEFALFAQKIDVDEELTRLRTHLGELRRIVNEGGAAGKRLDFMMQELNREVNTLGSKSVSTDVTNISIELKVLIEQMREQIQNIE